MAAFKKIFIFTLLSFVVAFNGVTEEVTPVVYPMSADGVVRLALENNFDVQLAKYDVWIKRTDKKKAASIYDTLLSGEVSYRDNESKRTLTILGTKETDNDYNVGLSKKLPTGTSLDADFANNRNASNATFATSAVTHESAVSLGVTQELGRNFFGIIDRGQIKITLAEIAMSNYTSLAKIENIVSEALKAYWDVVLHQNKLVIAQDMLQQAQSLYELNQKKFLDGAVEAVNALASEANYKGRLNQFELAQRELHEKMSTLKLMLNVENEAVIFEAAEKLEAALALPELSQALKEALHNRYDYQRALKEVEAKDIKVEITKSSLWPEINLTASLSKNGLGDHFKQSIGDISGDDKNSDFYAGVVISIPLENNKAEAEYKASELEKARGLIYLKSLERQIAVGINDVLRDCKIYHNVARSTDEIADLQKRKFNEENKRFLSGRSDADTLIRFQEDWLNAQLATLQAQYRYRLALIDLSQQKGELLKTYWNGDF